MKRGLCSILVMSTLFVCSTSYGAERKFLWYDEEFCGYDIKFDPGRYGQQQLKNTIDFILSMRLFELPSAQKYMDVDETGVKSFMEACERHIAQLAALPLIDIPGIELYRKIKTDQLIDECEFSSILMRGDAGNYAALREYKPSAAQCSRYVDALEGKTDIKAVWRDVVNSSCEQNYKSDVCRASHVVCESGPDAVECIRRDVLHYRWNNCSVSHLKVNGTKVANSTRMKLEAELRARLRIRSRPCQH